MRRALTTIVAVLTVLAILSTEAEPFFCQNSTAAKLNQEDAEKQNWASDFLKQNPLEQKSDDELTLDDLIGALQNPEQQRVLMRHFSRANLSPLEAEQFLKQALDSEAIELRIESVTELHRRGLLSAMIREQLANLKQDGNAEVALAAEQAGDLLELPALELVELPGLLDELVVQLRADDDTLNESAQVRFRQLGLSAVPTLLKLLKDDDPKLRKLAATLLGEIIASENSVERSYAMDKSKDPWSVFPPAKAGPESVRGPAWVRIMSAEPPKLVRVFYGTNRRIVGKPPRPWWLVWSLPVVFLALLFLFGRQTGKPRENTGKQSTGCLRLVYRAVIVVLMLATMWFWNSAIQQCWSSNEGVRFGTERDLPDVIHYGNCLVSLPATHESGKLERPWLGPENEQQHVVLKRTTSCEADEFYQAVRDQLALLPSSSRDCFVFVHGFNVSFENAALRTAQISYDLKVSGDFEGIPLFYSWPSAGSPILYSWDRAEIRNSKRYVKQFLQDVANNTQADRIHVVAHSMGADLVTQAIAEMDPDTRRFQQIVLAAPDIDADVFRSDIVPALARTSVRTTMYCSRNDLALQISYQVNNARRVGDTSDGVFVVEGVDTIDASEIPTDLLGHSYYGDCVPLAADIAALMKSNAAPNSQQRNLKSRPWREMFYWVFGE